MFVIWLPEHLNLPMWLAFVVNTIFLMGSTGLKAAHVSKPDVFECGDMQEEGCLC